MNTSIYYLNLLVIRRYTDLRDICDIHKHVLSQRCVYVILYEIYPIDSLMGTLYIFIILNTSKSQTLKCSISQS